MTNLARYDVAVVGAGPAGSIAALVLARAGARVALVDKASFPRHKACGDLVGPRGVRILSDLGVLPRGRRLGDMEVVGPTGRVVVLHATPGTTYPGFALSIPRKILDAGLRDAALDAGADGYTGRAAAPHFATDGELEGFQLDGGADDSHNVRADVVIGADGALSRVAAVARLVDESKALWGFAVRAYGDAGPDLLRVIFWEPSAWSGYPGYGWEFPGVEGTSNVGLGAAARGGRHFAAQVTRDLDGYVASLPSASSLHEKLGGWLKLGIVGTVSARGRTLLVGDAAGLVNPLQGEGISQALASGQAAAEAILSAGPSGAAGRYRQELGRRYGPYFSATAPVTALLMRRPRLTAGVGRLLTAPGLGRACAGAWALYWNDLIEGAPPGGRRLGASTADLLARLTTSRSRDARAIRESFTEEPANQPQNHGAGHRPLARVEAP
ncbi:MAG: geranylgeranyl reductase family protein [Acidimicrobiales bacterium]